MDSTDTSDVQKIDLCVRESPISEEEARARLISLIEIMAEMVLEAAKREPPDPLRNPAPPGI